MAISICVGVAYYISKDEIHNLEIRTSAQISATKIREILTLINSLDFNQRALIRQHLKRDNIFYITGRTRFYFPEVIPIVKSEDLQLGILEVIDNLDDFNIVAAGQSAISELNIFESDIIPTELISLVVELFDGTFVWIGISEDNFVAKSLFPIVVPILLISLPIVIIIILTLWWLLRPLRQLSSAAKSIGSSIHTIPKLPESKLSEIKNVSTALKEMHSNLKKQFDTLMVTLGALSHDLRTPLQKLRLRAELIKNKSERNKIHKDIEELHKKVEDGLFYLRISANDSHEKNIKLLSQRIDLADNISQLVDGYQSSTDNIKFTFDNSQIWQISINWISMARALGNLIDNGLMYGIKVEIALEQNNNQMIIKIRDFGKGINKNEINQALTPFIRLDSSRSKNQYKSDSDQISSSGLGLSISKAIIEQQKGELILTNHPHGGLIASIILPKN